MTEFELKIADRLLRRQFETAMGKSVVKLLTELITNSDDSYTRLVHAGVSDTTHDSDFGSIVIEIDRSNRKIAVIDQAEGMTSNEMHEKFVHYGEDSGDRQSGVRTRSLFGKGLRDALFTQQYANVKSIKDGKGYVCKFKRKKKRGSSKSVIDIPDKPTKIDPGVRQAWGIKNNGTRVEFQLRKDFPFPQHDKLLERLSNFYMLRLINSTPERSLILRTRSNPRKVKEDSITYSFPLGNIVKNVDAGMTYEDENVKINGYIARANEPLSQHEAGYEDREGGLLIFDEDEAVLDLTLFGFEESPHASHLYGQVSLVGAGEIIRDKLNQEYSEEILTETRDGFDRKHDFYKELRSIIDPLLEPIVQNEAAKKSKEQGELSEETKKRQRKAFDKLNNLYKEMMGPSDTPVPGPTGGPNPEKPKDVIEFIRPSITIGVNKIYPVPLLIDTEKVEDGEKVLVTSSNSTVEAEPSSFFVDHSKSVDGVLLKIVQVKGLTAGSRGIITASVIDKKAELDVTVIEKFVPVLNDEGLIFLPDQIKIHSGGRRRLDLYINLGKVNVGSVIKIGSSLPKFIKTDNEEVVVEDHMILSDDVALAQLSITGHGIGNKGKISAQINGLKAEASIKVISRKEDRKGEGGLIKDYHFEELPRQLQTYFDKENGIILINLNDPTNRRYFGENSTVARERVEKLVPCQIRLADLIIDECLQYMVSTAWHEELIQRRLPDDPVTDIRNYVSAKKYEIGLEIHQDFVNPNLLKTTMQIE